MDLAVGFKSVVLLLLFTYSILLLPLSVGGLLCYAEFSVLSSFAIITLGEE